MGILVAVIVVGLGVLGFLLLSGDDDDEGASPTSSTAAPATQAPVTEPPETTPPATEEPTTPPETDAPVTIDTEGEMVSVFDLSEGDCWDDPSETSDTVNQVEVVPCDEPHDNEVYLVFDLADGDFDASAVQSDADTGCLDAFDAFVGTPYEDSRLDYFNLTPTADSWDAGDREVVCSLYDIDLKKLVGSMEGSGV